MSKAIENLHFHLNPRARGYCPFREICVSKDISMSAPRISRMKDTGHLKKTAFISHPF